MKSHVAGAPGQHDGKGDGADERAVEQCGVHVLADELSGEHVVKRVEQSRSEHQQCGGMEDRRSRPQQDQDTDEPVSDAIQRARVGRSPRTGPESITMNTGARNRIAEPSASGR